MYFFHSKVNLQGVIEQWEVISLKRWRLLIMAYFDQVMSMYFYAGLGLALDQFGWTMSTVRALSHTSLPVQTGELGRITVIILRMWRFIVQVIPLYCKLPYIVCLLFSVFKAINVANLVGQLCDTNSLFTMMPYAFTTTLS